MHAAQIRDASRISETEVRKTPARPTSVDLLGWMCRAVCAHRSKELNLKLILHYACLIRQRFLGEAARPAQPLKVSVARENVIRSLWCFYAGSSVAFFCQRVSVSDESGDVPFICTTRPASIFSAISRSRSAPRAGQPCASAHSYTASCGSV